MRLSKLPKHMEHIETSLGAAKGLLAKETAEPFHKELEWTHTIVKLVEPKFAEGKDKEKKDQARKTPKELNRKLGALSSFRGRDLKKFQGYMQEAEALAEE